MAWRTVEWKNSTWSVTCAAEQRGRASRWRLMLGFRRVTQRETVWTEYPVVCLSRGEVFQAANDIPPGRLTELLAHHLE